MYTRLVVMAVLMPVARSFNVQLIDTLKLRLWEVFTHYRLTMDSEEVSLVSLVVIL